MFVYLFYCVKEQQRHYSWVCCWKKLLSIFLWLFYLIFKLESFFNSSTRASIWSGFTKGSSPWILTITSREKWIFEKFCSNAAFYYHKFDPLKLLNWRINPSNDRNQLRNLEEFKFVFSSAKNRKRTCICHAGFATKSNNAINNSLIIGCNNYQKI